MRRHSKFASRRAQKAKKARLLLETLEDRRCPRALVYAGFVPNTAILNIQEIFGDNSPNGGTGSTLIISGNTPPGGGSTTMITVQGGFNTSIDSFNAVTFTTAPTGPIAAIDVTLLNENSNLIVGVPTGIINLPGTSLNVSAGGGNNTFTMGLAGGPANLPAVNSVLSSVNFKAANVNSTGMETVDILDAMVASINIQENSGSGDRVRLWGVTASGQVNVNQNNGASDLISIDQLSFINSSKTLPSVLGGLTTAQGDGRVDNTTINRTQVGTSLSATQGNGNSDGLYLGTGDTVGALVTPPGGPPTTIWNGPVLLAQGSGADDYVGVSNLSAGVVNLLQQDLAMNATGDQVGGTRTNVIPPASAFGAAGADAATTTTASLPNGAGGVSEVVNQASPPFSNPLSVTAPSDGFRNALLEQLNVTQGSAAGDIVALVQLPSGSTVSESLLVPGAPFIPGVPRTPGTVTILQQDAAGNGSDFVFMGSYTLNPNFAPAAPGDAGYGAPPYAWTAPVATGSVTANNASVTQGNASGDVLSVLFTTATSTTTAESSQFVQGSGADNAYFQVDNAVMGGSFNYTGGSGGNHVQADSVNAVGTFDGGSSVTNNVLGQDNNNNTLLLFVDFGTTIFA